MLDANIVAVSLPAIASDFRGAFTDVEWVDQCLRASLLCPPDAGGRTGRSGRATPHAATRDVRFHPDFRALWGGAKSDNPERRSRNLGGGSRAAVDRFARGHRSGF